MDPSDVRAGVSAAMWDWLTEHDITVQLLIKDAVKGAVAKWLDDNGIEGVSSDARSVS